MFEYLVSIIARCILFYFGVMCSCLFKIIIVLGIHHWNYLGSNVYFFNHIHVDFVVMCSVMMYGVVRV